MKFFSFTVATAALSLAFGAHATTIVTNTPYVPGADTTLATFGDGSELVAQTTTFQNDPNGRGFDVMIKSDPAGPGLDMADESLNYQFANLYFGNPINGAILGFEVENDRVFVPGVAGYYNYSSALGITWTDTPGTTYANGGAPSEIDFYVPYAAYNTLLTETGQTPVAPGGDIQLRDTQVLGFAGNNAGGGARFGTITIPGVPEPQTWALMLIGIGGIGGMMRRRPVPIA